MNKTRHLRRKTPSHTKKTKHSSNNKLVKYDSKYNDMIAEIALFFVTLKVCLKEQLANHVKKVIKKNNNKLLDTHFIAIQTIINKIDNLDVACLLQNLNSDNLSMTNLILSTVNAILDDKLTQQDKNSISDLLENSSKHKTKKYLTNNMSKHKTIKQHGGANWYGCILKDTYPNIKYLPDAAGDEQTKRDFLKNLQKEKGRIHFSKSICKRNDGYPPNKFKNLQSCIEKVLEDPNVCFPPTLTDKAIKFVKNKVNAFVDDPPDWVKTKIDEIIPDEVVNKREIYREFNIYYNILLRCPLPLISKLLVLIYNIYNANILISVSLIIIITLISLIFLNVIIPIKQNTNKEKKLKSNWGEYYPFRDNHTFREGDIIAVPMQRMIGRQSYIFCPAKIIKIHNNTGELDVRLIQKQDVFNENHLDDLEEVGLGRVPNEDNMTWASHKSFKMPFSHIKKLHHVNRKNMDTNLKDIIELINKKKRAREQVARNIRISKIKKRLQKAIAKITFIEYVRKIIHAKLREKARTLKVSLLDEEVEVIIPVTSNNRLKPSTRKLVKTHGRIIGQQDRNMFNFLKGNKKEDKISMVDLPNQPIYILNLQFDSTKKKLLSAQYKFIHYEKLKEKLHKITHSVSNNKVIQNPILDTYSHHGPI